MKERTSRILITMLLLLPAWTLAQAQQDENRARLLATGDSDMYPGADIVVVYDSTDVDVEDSGLSHVRMHRLVRVLTAKGARDLRHVIYGYDPLSADVEVLRVRIYRSDGSVETVCRSRPRHLLGRARKNGARRLARARRRCGNSRPPQRLYLCAAAR
jgi:hypothetical protein